MIVLNIHRAEFEVLDATATDGRALKVLVLIDPATGIQVHAPFFADRAAELGGRLEGSGKLVRATAADLRTANAR